MFSSQSLFASSAALLATLAMTGALPAEAGADRPVVPTNRPEIFQVPTSAAGHDVIEASAATLAARGLPPRPNILRNPEGYAQWKRAMLALKRQAQGVLKPGPERNGPASFNVTNGAALPANDAGLFYSPNWSGYVGFTSATSYNQTTSFQGLAGTVELPAHAYPVACGTPNSAEQHVASWVGIDGQGSSDVLQAGASVVAFCGSNTNLFYTWVEWFPAGQVILPISADAGQFIYVQVWNTSATDGYAFVENLNTGVGGNYYLPAPNGVQLIGNSAEWITEAPGLSINGGPAFYSILPNYGTIGFSKSYAEDYSANLYYPTAANIYEDALYGYSGYVLSAPQPVSLKSFVTFRTNPGQY